MNAPFATSVRRGLGPLAVLLILGAALAPARAQSVSIGGFIKSSYYYDTRQVADVREGDFVLYPLPENLVTDENGDRVDANDTDNLLFFPFFSRLRLGIGDLPDALDAEVSGLIETDFFGFGNSTLNSLRIRRAFAKLDWGTHEALFGMEWSEFFLGTWPQTVATEAGAPFQPFARYPQIRLTLKPEGFRLIGLVAQQRDAFQEIGGLKLQQQSGLPMLEGHAQIVREGVTAGVGGRLKWIRPTLTADRFMAGGGTAYITIAQEDVQFRGKVVYGGDLADFLMTGGFATIADGDGDLDYRPLDLLTGWIDVQTTGPVGAGLFAGYLTNLGVADDLAGGESVIGFNARGADIDYVWRVAPRVVYNAGRLRFAGEVQVTSALYASELDPETLAPDAQDDDDAVTNVRGNFSVFLFF